MTCTTALGGATRYWVIADTATKNMLESIVKGNTNVSEDTAKQRFGLTGANAGDSGKAAVAGKLSENVGKWVLAIDIESSKLTKGGYKQIPEYNYKIDVAGIDNTEEHMTAVADPATVTDGNSLQGTKIQLTLATGYERFPALATINVHVNGRDLRKPTTTANGEFTYDRTNGVITITGDIKANTKAVVTAGVASKAVKEMTVTVAASGGTIEALDQNRNPVTGTLAYINLSKTQAEKLDNYWSNIIGDLDTSMTAGAVRDVLAVVVSDIAPSFTPSNTVNGGAEARYVVVELTGGTVTSIGLTRRVASVVAVSLDHTTLTVAGAGTATLNATFNDGDSGQTVTSYHWESDTPAVASVAAGNSGSATSTTVTWVSGGTAKVTVTATLSGGDTVTATCDVTCETPSAGDATITLADIEIEKSDSTGTLTATFDAGTSGLTVSKHEWALTQTGTVISGITADTNTTNTNTATWAGNGTATVTVTATLSNGATLSDTCTVTCTEDASVTLDNSTLNVANGGTGSLTATYNAGTSNLTVTKYEWASDDDSVATVTAGGGATDTRTTVTWAKAGTANVTVTVTLGDGSTTTATCAVTCAS